ncbi:c-type cytochrome [Variovorax dokdonensis]|uniref:C-type cytochrome n=1 Tax=Variovorax dokdonensis TaxID=344883 RepID=A0ABT7N9G9_9BURK|nr:c-type cytochrome [Variovorax dokdonensis]MDM0044591.1 c-type cytochrome [Variovorax dokdonensis]
MTRARNWLRRAGIAVAVLLILVAIALFAGAQMSEHRRQRLVELPSIQAVAYRTDAASVARGQYLFASRGCVDCHGEKGNGRMFVDDGKGLRIAGPHIAPGPGSVTAAYAPIDWVRAIRHGVNRDGRPLMVMPSEDYNRFTDDDLASLVAYIRQMPPAEGGPAVVDFPLPVRVAYGFGVMKDAAAKIDHSLPPQMPVPDSDMLARGAYVANMCQGCHGAKLQGGKIPGGPPDWPAAPRLTSGEGSVMPNYASAEDFGRMFKTGRRADGSAIQVMPFGSLSQMNDKDVHDLYAYLRSLAGKVPG